MEPVDRDDLNQQTESTSERQNDEREAGMGEAPSLEELEAELAKARAEAAEYLDRWRRANADLSNARKRMQRELADFAHTASARVIEKLIPVLDDFERAFEALPAEQSGDEWVTGFRLIQRKLQSLLDSEGVTLIPAIGEQFDPTLHQAVSHEENADHPEGEVIGEVARGYKLGDRILRPSMVRVSRGSDSETGE